MAAINLDSLRTFWTSAKAYILTHFLKKSTLLGYVNQQTSITLSVDIRNYAKISVIIETNDGVFFDCTFAGNTSAGTHMFPAYGSSVNTNTTSPGSWLKLIRMSISSDGKTISIAGINEVNFKSSSIGVASTTCYIRDVWGIP